MLFSSHQIIITNSKLTTGFTDKILAWGRFGLGTFWPGDVLAWGRLAWGRFGLWTF
jgi:hypothetical protein